MAAGICQVSKCINWIRTRHQKQCVHAPVYADTKVCSKPDKNLPGNILGLGLSNSHTMTRFIILFFCKGFSPLLVLTLIIPCFSTKSGQIISPPPPPPPHKEKQCLQMGQQLCYGSTMGSSQTTCKGDNSCQTFVTVWSCYSFWKHGWGYNYNDKSDLYMPSLSLKLCQPDIWGH